MIYLFAKNNEEALAHYAWSKTLVAFDFDGTLAPIVADPGAAKPRQTTLRLLAQVAKRYPCVIISGRQRSDVVRRLHGVPVHQVIGNHGLEPSDSTKESAHLVSRWAPKLAERLRSKPGVVIENKKFSIAVHYRGSRRKKQDKADILIAAGALVGARVIGGKQVVNIVPQGAPHKGLALERVRRRLHCDNAIYVGDDDTDEDVFAWDRSERLLSIRVGSSASSAARYFLKNQSEMERLLRRLCELREDRAKLEHHDDAASNDDVFAFMQSIWGLNRELELLSRRMLSTIGITGPQRLALRLIGRFPSITAHKVAQLLCVNRSTMSSLIAGLAERRLIDREVDPLDRRRVLLKLSPRGRTLDIPASDTLEAAVKKMLAQKRTSAVHASSALLDQLAELLRTEGTSR